MKKIIVLTYKILTRTKIFVNIKIAYKAKLYELFRTCTAPAVNESFITRSACRRVKS